MSSDTIVDLIVGQYQKRKLIRGPYSTQGALAKSADATSIERIIADESELAWHVFSVVKKWVKSTHGFAGKAKLARLLTALSTQSVEQQQIFAKELAIRLSSCTPQPMDTSEDAGPTRGAKRRCTENGISATPITTTTSHNDLTSHTAQQASDNGNHQHDLYFNASLKPSKALLPSELMDAVVRLPNPTQPESLAADISMVLQKGNMRDHFGCQMEIGITREKVAFYAKRLFNVEVEVKDGIRFIRCPGGTKIEPNPSVNLRACSKDAISSIFGSDVATAISRCPLYRREEKEARDQTDGVSMAITNRDSEAGRITLFLGEFIAYDIKNKLYG